MHTKYFKLFGIGLIGSQVCSKSAITGEKAGMDPPGPSPPCGRGAERQPPRAHLLSCRCECRAFEAQGGDSEAMSPTAPGSRPQGPAPHRWVNSERSPRHVAPGASSELRGWGHGQEAGGFYSKGKACSDVSKATGRGCLLSATSSASSPPPLLPLSPHGGQLPGSELWAQCGLPQVVSRASDR